VTKIGNVADATLDPKYSLRKKTLASRDGYAFTAPVGRFPANAFGLHDMVGNATELCGDWYNASYYAESPETDPAGPPFGERRVIRGSSWFHVPSSVADRFPAALSVRHNDMGFRVACDLDAAAKPP
jgi:formylglycine-generating enzyme required for sulfatase activity